MKKNAKNTWVKMTMGIGITCLLSLSSCGVAENADEVDTETTGAEEGAEIDDGMFASNDFYDRFNTANLFKDRDRNSDNFLDENEFNDSNYEMWDTDKDGMLEESEWNEDVKNFGLGDENWGTWDANKDNQVDKNEFNAALKDDNYFSAWDADKNNRLTDREYTDGVFGMWDDNGDGFVEKDRYDNHYNTYFGN